MPSNKVSAVGKGNYKVTDAEERNDKVTIAGEHKHKVTVVGERKDKVTFVGECKDKVTFVEERNDIQCLCVCISDHVIFPNALADLQGNGVAHCNNLCPKWNHSVKY